MSTENTSLSNKHVISTDEVLERTALSKSMLYRLLRQDKFPLPTPMSKRSIGWFEDEIENWLQRSKATRRANLRLPLIYMAGSMGVYGAIESIGSNRSSLPISEVPISDSRVEFGAEGIVIAPPQEMVFHGTRTRFMYSGPWKSLDAHNEHQHPATSASIDGARNAAYHEALQGISRADVVVAYLEDLQAYGTLVEIGYARAACKRVIVITSPALHKAPLNNSWGSGLWVAIRAADRHIALPDQSGSTSEEQWCLAHVHAAMTIAEWYPNTMVDIS